MYNMTQPSNYDEEESQTILASQTQNDHSYVPPVDSIVVPSSARKRLKKSYAEVPSRCKECHEYECEVFKYHHFLVQRMKWEVTLIDKHHDEWRKWYKDTYRFLKSWELYNSMKEHKYARPDIFSNNRCPKCMLQVFEEDLREQLDPGSEGNTPLGLEIGDASEVLSDDNYDYTATTTAKKGKSPSY